MSDDKNDPDPVESQDNVAPEPAPVPKPDLPEMGHQEFRGDKPDDVKTR